MAYESSSSNLNPSANEKLEKMQEKLDQKYNDEFDPQNPNSVRAANERLLKHYEEMVAAGREGKKSLCQLISCLKQELWVIKLPGVVAWYSRCLIALWPKRRRPTYCPTKQSH